MAAYRLEHVGIVIPTEKREATMRFYESVFGWKLLREMTGVAFVGKHSVTLTLRPGQWFFYPTFVGTKTYFLVTR